VLTVALTGGIGSGKSLAGEYFELIGATVVDSDLLSREVIERGTEGFDELLSVFGDEILTDGNLDRKKLGAIVFADSELKGKLEEIVHPRVRLAFEEIVAEARPGEVIINEIPLLVETDGANRFDVVVTVTAPIEVRRSRLIARGMKGYEIDQRVAAQASDEERLAIADFELKNDQDVDHLLRQVENLYEDELLPRSKANIAK
jgi:dephospho-CoA kinase